MMSPTRILTSLALAGVIAAGGTACSAQGENPSPTDGPSATKGQQAPGRDISADLLAYQQPEPIASTSGDLETYFGKEAVTLEILELRSTPTGTVLTYRLMADKTTVHDIDRRAWAEQPRLVDSGAGQAYLVATAGHPDHEGEGLAEVTLSTGDNATGPSAPTQQGLYSTLPDSLAEVEVSMPGLEPVAVPVTR